MVKLSGFADEISPELDVQLDTLEKLGMRYIELRGVWGKNVLALSDEELAQVKTQLDQRSVKVSSIGSPLGKVPVDIEWDEYQGAVQRIIDIALLLDAPYIRMFSFYCEDREADRDRVMEKLQAMVDMAAAAGVVMAHENEKHIYGESAAQCLDLHKTIQGEAFKAILDPANYIQAGVKPFDEAYPLIKPYLAYYHIKDALQESGQVVPSGKGDGQVRELMAAVKESGFDGFLSLEPHLKSAGQFSGFSGPDLFETAVVALRGILDELDIPYE